uniref:Uncharacterized protein n=1 Tax=Anguilla anguilla TaxID=7936 RepID=A0A0E9TMM8_ANGAN
MFQVERALSSPSLQKRSFSSLNDRTCPSK